MSAWYYVLKTGNESERFGSRSGITNGVTCHEQLTGEYNQYNKNTSHACDLCNGIDCEACGECRSNVYVNDQGDLMVWCGGDCQDLVRGNRSTPLAQQVIIEAKEKLARQKKDLKQYVQRTTAEARERKQAAKRQQSDEYQGARKRRREHRGLRQNPTKRRKL